MAKTLQYRKTGAQTWLIATFDFVSPYTITELDPVEYEVQLYDDSTDLYSEIITQVADGGITVSGTPSSLVTTTVNTGINITDSSIYPKNGSTDIPFSIEIWLKPSEITSTVLPFNFVDSVGAATNIALIITSSATVRFSIQTSAGNRISIVTGGNAIEVNKWYQIVLTYDGSKTRAGMTMRINTASPSLFSADQGTYTGLPALSGNLVIQLPITNATEATKFVGKLNLFRFFLNKVLSEAETIELYNEAKTRPLTGLAFENTCVLEHQFNSTTISSIGQNASAVGTLVYDSDLPWSVSDNEVNFYSFTSFDSVMWTKMHKSSDWPEIPTSKPYFGLYSSDHSETGGGIAWFECDDVYFNGFVERGIILTGYQCETPWLVRTPGAVGGEIFLYYHTVTGEPGNDGKQQTRLMTTTGGALHTATWTDRGRPLGIFNDDVHTGYCRVFKRDDGTYVANHLTVGGSNPKTYISESTNGLTFTRVLETTGLTVDGYLYGYNHINPFKRNNIWYGFIRLKIDGGEKIAVVTLDNNFLPIDVIDVLPNFYTMNILMSYEEVNTAYLNFRYSVSGLRDQKTYMVEYDLTQLDA